MKSVPEILEILRDDLAADIPALLTAETLSNFANYITGGSRDESEIACCVYKSEYKGDDTTNNLTLTIQLQLYGIDYSDAEKYGQVVLDYMKIYDYWLFGMNYLDEINSDTWSIQENNTTFIYIDLTIIEELDSCD